MDRGRMDRWQSARSIYINPRIRPISAIEGLSFKTVPSTVCVSSSMPLRTECRLSRIQPSFTFGEFKTFFRVSISSRKSRRSAPGGALASSVSNSAISAWMRSRLIRILMGILVSAWVMPAATASVRPDSFSGISR